MPGNWRCFISLGEQAGLEFRVILLNNTRRRQAMGLANLRPRRVYAKLLPR